MNTALRVVLVLAASGMAFLPGQSDPYQELITLHSEIQSMQLDRLPQLTEASFEARAKRLPELKEQLGKLDPSQWPVSEKVDFLLVFSELSRLYFEHAALRPWRRDPGFYLDRIARIPFIDLPLSEQELRKLQQRLDQVPRILAQAQDNLTEGASELAQLALRNLEQADGVGHGHPERETPPAGVIGWYRDLQRRIEVHHPEATTSAVTASKSVAAFRDWLKREAPRMQLPAGVGAEYYDWYLKNVLLMPFDHAQVLTLGERELNRVMAFLALEQWRNRELPALQPASDAASYQQSIEEADRLVRRFIRERKILTLPPDLGSFGHNVPWTRRSEGKLNFWEAVQFRDPLPDHVHAVIPGHRFDAWLHRQDQRTIRKDFNDSGRIEGWAFYLEETLLQLGLLQDRPRTRELYYIFQAARAVRNRAEVELHLNRWTIEQAVQYMQDNVPFMDEDVARVDCEIYLRRPGYGISYSIGRIQIEQLLADRKRQLKDGFQLDRFHDQFLAAGWIPISLIRWEMTGLDDQMSAYEKLLSGPSP